MAALRPNRSDIVAGLSLVVALLAVIWSGRGNSTSGTGLSSREPQTANEPSTNHTLPPLPLVGGDLDTLSQTSTNVVARASRAVVRVEHASKRRTTAADDLELYFGTLPSETFGSGVVVDASGLVLTNYHVVRGADNIVVRGVDNLSRRANLIGFDTLTDLALLNVPELKLPALSWGDSREVVSGQLVWAMGSPYGLDQSASLGIVSAINRPTLLDSPFQDFLQTDAAINPGSSGGPLLDARAAIIGINTAMAADNFIGIGFALPSHAARQVFEQLRDHGRVPRGWIGVQLGSVSAARGAMAGVAAGEGAYIESLAVGQAVPAVEAGLRVADICTEFQGQKVTGPLGLIRNIAGHPIGTTANLSLIRAGQPLQVKVMVQVRPE